MDEQDVMRRAMAAYFRGTTEGAVDYPSSIHSGVEVEGDKWYVVLRNGNGLLAVYRVKPDGFLRRLRRWPKALEET